ncbi:hypothetical protein FRC05_010349, partial [Tulasnella sp. 425]
MIHTVLKTFDHCRTKEVKKHAIYFLLELEKRGKISMQTMQRGKGSVIDKGILLSIDQTSPRQFDKIAVIISSDKAGVFTLEIKDTSLDITKGTTDLKMEELLQAQYEHRTSLSLFDSMAKVNLNLLLYQINK